nr:UDP binding domain-containing protein [Tessaracoccus coleopterorum]
MRESPAISIAVQLADRMPTAHLLAVEPHVHELPSQLAGRDNVALTGTDEALDTADILVVLVDHDAFRAVPADRVAGRALIDAKGLWDRKRR